ncbi:MAG: YkvA family protein [Erythrobacter sp.]|nr:YkvA family protein [Erythrobacter sp.]
MIVQQLRQHVELILGKPDARDRLDHWIEVWIAEHGIEAADETHAELARICETYVTDTVELIAACDAVAPGAGVGPVAGQILVGAAQYFFEPNDLVPDSEGLLGLLDDAYLANRYIARLSELYQAETGMALLDTGLDNLSDAIRALLGPQIIAALDQMAEAGISQAVANVQMNQFQPLPLSEAERWQRVQADRANNDLARGMAILSGGGY